MTATRRQGRAARLPHLAGSCGLVLALVSTTATAQVPLRLVPGADLEAQLAPAQTVQYRLRLAAGQALDLSLTQRDATLQLRWQQPPGAPSPLHQNDAGQQARLRLTLVATRVGEVLVTLNGKDGAAAHYRLQTSAARPATALDRRRAAAQQALYTAENLRRAAGSLEAGRKEGAAARAGQLMDAYQTAASEAAAAHDRCTASMARAGLARWHFAQGDYAQARREAEAALPTGCGEAADPLAADVSAADVSAADVWAAAEAAVAERTLGSALGYQGDLVAATQISERALARYRQTGDLRYQAMLLGNLSANYRVLGESHRALATAQAALALAQTLGDKKRVLFIRESMAAIHLQRGELAPALKIYREVTSGLVDTPYPLVEGMSWNNLGLVYTRLGDARAADDAYARATQAWTLSGDRAGLAETGLNAADSLLDAGRVDAAEQAYRAALAFDREHGFQREEIHALGGLGRSALARGDWPQALEHLQAALGLAQKIHAEALQAGLQLALGDLAGRRGDAQAARTEYARALALAVRVDDRATRAAAQASLARLDARAGQLTAAQQGIEAALALFESERAAIPDPQLRTTYFAGQRAYHDLYIDVLMRRHAREPAAGFAALALQAAERARARSLLELLSSRRIDLQPDMPAELAAALREAEDRRRELAWRLAQLPPTETAARDALRRDIDHSERELDALRGRVQAADPRYAALARPAPLQLAEVQRELADAGSVIYEYWLGEERSTLWRMTAQGLDTAQLPGRARIEGEIDALRERLRAPPALAGMPIAELAARQQADTDATLRQAARVGELLLPRRWRSDARRQVIVADGKIQFVPFSLFSRDSRAAQVYLPSLTSLRELRRQPRGTGRLHAVLADPVFRADDARLSAAAGTDMDTAAAALAAAPLDLSLLRAAGGLGELPRLRQTRREAQRIADLGDGASWIATDFQASRRAVLAADWSRYATVHFATHALVDLRNPELSGIVLSLYDAQGRPEDGFLRVGDLYHLRMPVDLVVLSVCDSAGGDSPGAEGVFSLARGFFHAGARRVVASLWPVDDRASAAFMEHFYTALLRERLAPEQALLAAQARLRADPRWRAPAYWAAYVLQGDWSAAPAP